MSVPEVLLAAEDIRVELGGVAVLELPSFALHESEVLSVVGPNGSGKSTLLLTLACLLRPSAGHISYRGNVLVSHDAVFRFRRRISMVFQEPLLFDTTVYKNVASGLRIRGLSRNETRDRVAKYLKCFHCEHLAQRSARKLSGGESQRISLARAFAVEPEILLLDEPFSALDPPTRHSLMHDLEAMVRETKTTTIMVTHLESEALSMSSRILVLNEGRVVQTGTPSQVMSRPSNQFVARFVGMENILEGRVISRERDGLSVAVSGRVLHSAGDAQPDEIIECCIRPENVTIDNPDAAGAGNTNRFSGTVTHIYSSGPFVKVSLDCGFHLTALVTREAFSDLRLSEGTQVSASFRPSSVHVIRRSKAELERLKS
ncbi:MAG: ABC transporter ATP-binding protein [Acidobacteria bacterium]|nr:ABC transporter ATP-binding protein [Acidobacteriota bacterium]